MLDTLQRSPLADVLVRQTHDLQVDGRPCSLVEIPFVDMLILRGDAADPHFEVSPTGSSPIRPGDWGLIDLWARLPGDHNIFSDITWVGYCGDKVPTKQREIFEVVRAARDASLARAKQAWKKKARLEGWQLDDAARAVIIEAGYERTIRHRTGHSLSPGYDEIYK